MGIRPVPALDCRQGTRCAPRRGNAGPRRERDPRHQPGPRRPLKAFTDVHIPWGAAAGADGRAYFGGKVVRTGNGGGLGWWDVTQREAGGIHDPFEMYTVFFMCSAAAGRSILCSTKAVAAADNPDFVPPRGMLFVYDTTTHEFLREVDDERLGAFVDGDVYVAGTEKFRRIKGIPKLTAAAMQP